MLRHTLAVLCCAALSSCSASGSAEPMDDAVALEAPSAGGQRSRTVRLTGTLEAVRSTRVVAPALTGPSSRMTLTRLVPNGSRVAAGAPR